MASCVKNICKENCPNLIIGFQFTVENVGNTFWKRSVVTPLRRATVRTTKMLQR